jgi:polar amino acid transport system substrate-binding protein
MTILRHVRSKLVLSAGYRVVAAAAMLACWVLAWTLEARAQPLRIAVYDAPPYASVAQDGSFTGASVDLWRRVAEDIGRNYQLILVSSMEDVLRGVEARSFDAAIGAITITED